MSWWRKSSVSEWPDTGWLDDDSAEPENEPSPVSGADLAGRTLRKGDQEKVVTTPEDEARARWDGWK